jgi:hypothetical protein
MHVRCPLLLQVEIFTFPSIVFPTVQPAHGFLNLLQPLMPSSTIYSKSMQYFQGLGCLFWNLATSSFLVQFNLQHSGLPQALQPFLLDGCLEKQGMEAELCELNVYGKLFDPFQMYKFRLEPVLACRSSHYEEQMFVSGRRTHVHLLIVSSPTR